MTTMTEILRGAEKAVTGRGADYGPPEIMANTVAMMWSAVLGMPVTGAQVLLCQALWKVGRLAHSPGHVDSAVDLAGYAAMYGQTAAAERRSASSGD